MHERERKACRLNVHLVGGHKDGLEANALLSDITLSASLGALANVAYCREILSGESVFVAFKNDMFWKDFKGDVGIVATCCRVRIVVVVSVLEELKDKPRVASVQVLC